MILSQNSAANLLWILIVTVSNVDMIETFKAFYTNWRIWSKFDLRKIILKKLFKINYSR